MTSVLWNTPEPGPATMPAPVPASEHCMCPNCVAHRQYMADRRKTPRPLALTPDNDRGRVWP